MSTTEGHDLLAEVGDLVPTEIAQALWRAGKLPTHLKSPPLLAGTPFANLEVFTQPPSVVFPADPRGLVGVLRQPMIIRNDTVSGEVANILDVRLPLTLVEDVVDGVTVQLLVLDLAQATVHNTAFTDSANAFAEVVVAWLAALLTDPVRLPVTPPMLPEVRFFGVRGTSPPLSVKVYANLDGRPAGATTSAPALMKFQPQFDPPPFPDLAGVVDGAIFLQQVHAELARRNIVAGQTVLDEQRTLLFVEAEGDVTIDPQVNAPFFPGGFRLPLKLDFSPRLQRIVLTKDVTIELGTGRIRVASAIKAIIDNAPDIEVDFDLRVGFHFAGGKLVPRIDQADVDVDTSLFQVLLTVLLGPFGLMLAGLVDDAIDAAASAAVGGQAFPVGIPHRTVFLGDVAITNDPAVDQRVVCRLHPRHAIVRPDAVGADFTFEATGRTVPIPVPGYVIGNRISRELHRPGCKFEALMSPSNRVQFIRAAEAVARGYNGCRLCLPEFDS